MSIAISRLHPEGPTPPENRPAAGPPTPARSSARPAAWHRRIGLALLAALMLALPPLPAAHAGVKVGDPAPDFTAENLQDTAPDFFQLSSYRGSIVVIEFFAYW